MALIGMAIYSTEENKKDSCLEKTMAALQRTVDFSKHRLIVSVNAATERTDAILKWYSSIIQHTIINDGNIGTAKAINKCWVFRKKGENAIKMDDDIVTTYVGWTDELEAAIARDALIGQCGLKRKDCWEWPGHDHPDWKSELAMLPHAPGESWIIVEKVKHVIGSCVMHSSALLDKVGFLYQPSQYGYDDVIMSHRTYLAGFYSCFLPHVPIDHIDDGKTPFQGWKERHSGEQTQKVIALVHDMYNYKQPIYYEA